MEKSKGRDRGKEKTNKNRAKKQSTKHREEEFSSFPRCDREKEKFNDKEIENRKKQKRILGQL